MAPTRLPKYFVCKTGRFYEKPASFVSLRGAQRRGNLKASSCAVLSYNSGQTTLGCKSRTPGLPVKP